MLNPFNTPCFCSHKKIKHLLLMPLFISSFLNNHRKLVQYVLAICYYYFFIKILKLQLVSTLFRIYLPSNSFFHRNLQNGKKCTKIEEYRKDLSFTLQFLSIFSISQFPKKKIQKVIKTFSSSWIQKNSVKTVL